MFQRAILMMTVVILIGCASGTTIKTFPAGARVYKDGALLGETPHYYWDRAVGGTDTKIVLKMSGYRDKEVTIKTDALYFGRIFIPLISYPWLLGYPEQYVFELDKIDIKTDLKNTETEKGGNRQP